MIRRLTQNKASPTRPALLQPDAAGWRLGSVGPGGLVLDERDVDLVGLGDAKRPPRLVLALASGEWLCGGISTSGLTRRGRAGAMLYRLEEKLPVAAEELAAAFVETGEAALGVATDSAALRERIGPLATANVRVVAVSPLALLALQGKPAAAETGLLVWQDGEEAEVFALTDGRPTSWATLPADAVDVNLHVRLLAGDGELPAVELRDVSPELAQGLAHAGVEATVTVTDGLALCAVAGAARVQAGEPPLADVARSVESLDDARSAGAAVTALLLAACLFLAACSAAMLWTARGLDAQRQAADATLRAAFGTAFPGERVPATANVRRRLEIAARNADPADSPASAPSALETAGRVLADLPRNLRFQLFELRVTPGELYLDGQVRSHGDADAVAAALRDLKSYDIAPPATEQIDAKTVGFRITGTPPARAPAPPAERAARTSLASGVSP